jgi:chromosome segregation ATPase
MKLHALALAAALSFTLAAPAFAEGINHQCIRDLKSVAENVESQFRQAKDTLDPEIKTPIRDILRSVKNGEMNGTTASEARANIAKLKQSERDLDRSAKELEGARRQLQTAIDNAKRNGASRADMAELKNQMADVESTSDGLDMMRQLVTGSLNFAKCVGGR